MRPSGWRQAHGHPSRGERMPFRNLLLGAMLTPVVEFLGGPVSTLQASTKANPPERIGRVCFVVCYGNRSHLREGWSPCPHLTARAAARFRASAAAPDN